MINFIGRTIQHYQVLLKIRETPTRILYRAYDKKAHSYAALEVVKNSRLDPVRLLGLINEQAQKNARLTHPNIAVMTDSGIYNGTVYLVYDFYPTHPLRRFFNRTYPWEEMARELAPIAHTLMYAHDSDVVHGFLNPAGIILDEKRNPILFDFGFEQIITEYVLAHSPGTWINRWGLEYRAPEHLNGSVPDKRCDIYSFGMIIREWLTGSTTINNTRGKRKSSREKKNERQTLPVPVQNFIGRCTSPGPSDRYGSMQEVFALLANGALNMAITNQMVRKPLRDPTRNFRYGWLIAGMVLGIVLLAAGGIFITMPELLSGSTPPTLQATVFATQTPVQARNEPTTAVDLLTSPPVPTSMPPETEFQSGIAFQGTPLTSLVSRISPDNAGRIGLIGRWGMGDLTHLAASPDGQRVAVATSMGILVFRLQNLELEKYLDTGSWISTIDFSADGKLLASGGRDGLIEVWDTTNWQEAAIPFSGHTRAIIDLAFSPDGTKLSSVGEDNKLIQWTVQDPADRKSVDLPLTGVNAVAYTADNSQIISGGNDFKIRIWDAGNLEESKPATLSAKIVDIARAGDTGLFVIGSTDQRVTLFDLANGLTLQPLGSLQYPLTTVAASSSGDLFAAGDLNGGITVWDRNGSQVWKTQNYVVGDITSLELPGSPHSISFSPDGKLLFSGLHDGMIRSLDARTGKELQKNPYYKGHVEKLVPSDDNNYAITQYDNQTITLWDLRNGKPLNYLEGEIGEGFPFSLDSRLLAVAVDGSRVKVYENPGLNEVYTLNNHRDVQVIKFIEEDAQLAAGNNRDMHLWSMSSGQELIVQPNFPGTGCNSITDMNGRLIFLITDYQFIVPFNQTNQYLCEFQKLNWTTDIDRNAQFIAYGGSSKLSVIDLQSQLSPATDMDVNRKNVVSVAVSPGGDLLAAAFDDNVIHLWNVSSRQEITSLYGHNGLITDLVFTADGKMLFSTSMDGTIRIWGIPN